MNINDIRNKPSTYWNPETVQDAINALKSVNTTLVEREIISGLGGRLEVLVSISLGGKPCTFQASPGKLAELVNANVTPEQWAVMNEERAAKARLEVMEMEKRREEQKAAKRKANAQKEIDEAIGVIKGMAERFIKTAECPEEENSNMAFHVNRCLQLKNWQAKTNGQWLDIAKELCWMPQSLGLRWKAGQGWRCKSKAMAEAIEKLWNDELSEVCQNALRRP